MGNGTEEEEVTRRAGSGAGDGSSEGDHAAAGAAEEAAAGAGIGSIGAGDGSGSAAGAGDERSDAEPDTLAAADRLSHLSAPPASEGSAPARTRRGKGKRAKSRAEKDERNRKLKIKRDARKALQDQQQREQHVAAATDAARSEIRGAAAAPTPAEATPAIPDAPGEPAEGAPAPSREDQERARQQLITLAGLGCYAGVKMIPERWGGGDLTEDERAMLGEVWATVLAPYLSGEGGPIIVACVTTVQVLAVRAIRHESAAKTANESPAPAAAAAAPPAPAPTPAAATRPAVAGKPRKYDRP